MIHKGVSFFGVGTTIFNSSEIEVTNGSVYWGLILVDMRHRVPANSCGFMMSLSTFIAFPKVVIPRVM